MRKVFVFIFILLGILSIAEPVLACQPPPPPGGGGNTQYQNCESLGSSYKLGFKISGARNGTYHLTWHDGKLTGGAPEDQKNEIKISGSDGRTFDWQSTLGIDAVIVNAGGKSTVKKLDEQTEGQDYHGSTDWRHRPYSVDQIYFCYDYELTLSTNADGTYTSAATWAITKTVDTLAQAKFAGETANFNYTVAVDRTAGSNTGFNVNSKVNVKNETPLEVKVKSIKAYLTKWDKTVKLNCGDIDFPHTLQPGDEITCTGDTEVTSKANAQNWVQVTTRGNVSGGKAVADVKWSGDSSGGQVTGGPVTITDTNAAFGGPYTISDDKSWNYTVSLTCPSDPTAYTNGVYTATLNNTASITETAQQASQSVKLTCYAPVSSVTGQTAYDAKYTWAITKTSETKNLTLKKDTTAKVNYTVGVSVASQVESNFSYSGAIVLTNPHPGADMIITLADNVEPGVTKTMTDCSNPVTVPAGQTVTCHYAATPETKLSANAVQVVFNNIVFATATSYDFSKAAINGIDECVTVYDIKLDEPLGTVCADQAPVNYTYTLEVGPFSTCEETDFLNKAYFITNDTGIDDGAIWQVLIKVKCPPISTNCTYNTAYWSSHANPSDIETYNDAWDKLGPDGPNTAFFTTSDTWLQMLSKDASQSVYLQLAQSYMVSRLNVLYGATPSSILPSTLDHAAELLSQYATAQDTIMAGSGVEADFRNTTLTLDRYNNGQTGPGQCPDCQ